MFVFEQLKTTDRRLQVFGGAILIGLLILLGRLWQLQVLSAKTYRAYLENQTFRTVRVPAIRGKILDRNRVPLADNHPTYNLNLYLEELQPRFNFEYTNSVKKEFTNSFPNVKLTRTVIADLEREARYQSVSNLLFQVSASLQNPKLLLEKEFHQHYGQKRSLPLTLLGNLTFGEVAQLLESGSLDSTLDVEIEPRRIYPYSNAIAHLIGYVKREEEPVNRGQEPSDEDEINYRFWVPGYKGQKGIEFAFDRELRGKPGVKTVLVNSTQYRQSEELLQPPEPGKNVVLTIDAEIQKTADRVLRQHGEKTRGAVIVMQCQTGDILALASSPTFDPNSFIPRITTADWAQMNDQELLPLFNRAVYGGYLPGSTFKMVVSLACLENGLDPLAKWYSAGNFRLGRVWGDLAGVGMFDFRRAFAHSSNPYFQRHGMIAGPREIIRMGRQLGLGEPTGITGGQEHRGYLPNDQDLKKSDGSRWMDGDTANLSIGQGDITVTPLQMAVVTSAVANSGKVLKPRLVIRVGSQEPDSPVNPIRFPASQVRRRLNVSLENLTLLQQAMLDDVEFYDEDRGKWGTGHKAYIKDFRICGKTGTAQKYIKRVKHLITWFVSYAPFENPRYAVVVVIEGGSGGGTTCAPMARQIYQTIIKKEQESQR